MLKLEPSRDDAVPHYTYASVRRRDGVPQDLFARYWRDVHGPLCARLPGLGHYVQHHFDRERTAHLWPVSEGVRPMAAKLDGSAEMGFVSAREQARFAEAATILYADEANLFGEAVAYSLTSGSRTFVDHEENPALNGSDTRHRVHVYMTRRAGAETDAWLIDAFAALAAGSAVRTVKLHLLETYSNEHPAPPSPDVAHTVDADRLDLAIAEVAFESPRAARQVFAGSGFQPFREGESRYLKAVGAFRVSGVYTFVQEGRPTAAGVRGSSQAGLIEALGAANQLDPDVARLFVRA